MRRSLVLLAAVLLVVPLGPARAQLPVEPRIVRLASISPWIDSTHPFAVTLQITNPSELAIQDVEVRVRIFAPVTSRSQLRVALDRTDEGFGGTLVTQRLDTAIGPGQQRTVSIRRETSELGLRSSGVYPLSITVQHAAGSETFRSAVPLLRSAPVAALNVVWIVPITRPLVTPDEEGAYADDDIRALNLHMLSQQLDVLVRRRTLPITLAPSPALIDTLTDLADGFVVRREGLVNEVEAGTSEARDARSILDALQSVAHGAAEVAAVPYAPIDLPTLVEHGPRGDVARQLSVGQEVIEAATGQQVADGLLVPPGARVDAASLEATSEAWSSGVVVDPSLIEGALTEPYRPDLFGPSRPTRLRAGETRFTALLPDAPIAERLDGIEQGVLLGQALGAETASSWFEMPLFANERALVFWSRETPGPTALSAGLDALQSAPWARLQRASDVLRDLPPENDPAELLAVPPSDRSYIAAARSARHAYDTLQRILIDPLDELGSLHRLILLSEASVWDLEPSGGVALARAAEARVARMLGNIRVARRTVTLTSRRGRLPVTIINRNDFPVRVRIGLESTRLQFQDGMRRTVVVGPNSATYDFEVEARAAGSFPVDVRIETPEGARRLGDGQLIVRSTAVSAVSLGIVGGSLALLIGAWIRRARKRNGASKPGARATG